jgi:hypothetical protein
MTAVITAFFIAADASAKVLRRQVTANACNRAQEPLPD